jgi:hypothetical protein
LKYFLIALTCLATLSVSLLAYAPQDGKKAQPRASIGSTCQAEQGAVRGGKVVGTPGPNSKFKDLRLGMSKYAIRNLIGPPDDIEHYTTGKQFIPFYYGPDRYRSSEYYAGNGILVFSGRSGDRLIEIHHNEGESGNRSLR